MRHSGVATIFAASLVMVPGAAGAQQAFNGAWSVEVVTERGECDRAYRFPVIVQNGRIRYGGREGINIEGTVNARGTIRSTIAAGNLRAAISGRLAGRSGNGTWSLSGGRTCSGYWNAERRSIPAA